MANIFITQFVRQAVCERGFLPTGEEPSLGTVKVAIGATSAQSPVLNPATRFVIIATEAPCSIEFGANPTATNSTERLVAVGEYWRGIEGGLARGGCKIAVIE